MSLLRGGGGLIWLGGGGGEQDEIWNRYEGTMYVHVPRIQNRLALIIRMVK